MSISVLGLVMLFVLQCQVTEAEYQRLVSIAKNDYQAHIQNLAIAEQAKILEQIRVADAACTEKVRRERASAVRLLALNASRFTDPVDLEMARAPSGKDLDNFEHDPVQSILMMHSMFGNDFLLTPPPRDMTEHEEQEYKDAIYEQCAVSEATIKKCILEYQEEMSSER
jgi:hypothetical protein